MKQEISIYAAEEMMRLLADRISDNDFMIRDLEPGVAVSDEAYEAALDMISGFIDSIEEHFTILDCEGEPITTDDEGCMGVIDAMWWDEVRDELPHDILGRFFKDEM